METELTDTKDTQNLAKQLAEKLKAPATIALFGELGAGKTTFASFLVRELGFSNRVQSPTFVLARKYADTTKEFLINHVDLYRAVTLTDAEDIGIHEMLDDPRAINIIEWPELIDSILPKKTIKIYFTLKEGDVRNVKIQNLA